MKKILITIAALILFSACNTSPQENTATTNEYLAAVEAGNDILLDFFASWCTICRANQPHIEEALAELNDPNLVNIQVDYDLDTEMRARFDIFQQSMYVFIPDGNEEEARIIGPGVFRKNDFLELIKGE
jgi:thiol:disulfide interchange protein